MLNVARSSLEELLLDFEDYLRHRRLPQWAPDSPEALAVRRVAGRFRKDRTDPTDRTDQVHSTDHWALYAAWLEHNDPAVRANALICLINQANYLLDQQIAAAEKQFVEEGGYSEQLATARLVARSRKKESDQVDRTDQTDQSDRCEKIPPARFAVVPWYCGLPRAGRTPESSSGAAPHILNAKDL